MNVKKFFAERNNLRCYLLIATFACLIAGMICFAVLSGSNQQTDEQPEIIYAFTALALAACIAAGYKDWFGALSLAIMLFTSVAFFIFIAGRASYLAYYFSGDVMGTGLAASFVIGVIFYLAAFVLSVLSVCFYRQNAKNKKIILEDKKNEQV